MVAYEFSAEITEGRTLLIPEHYAQTLPAGAAVRVILLLEENQQADGGYTEPLILPSLEALVAEIKQMPPNPHNISTGSGKLGERLAHSLTQTAADFDLKQWTADWDRVEADMEAQSLSQEEIERGESLA